MQPSSGGPGSTVVVSGTNFAANATVTVYWGTQANGTVAASGATDANGNLEAPLSFPALSDPAS